MLLEGIVCGGSTLGCTSSGVVFLGCGCNVGCTFGATNFLLTPALPCPVLGRDGGIILCGLDTDSGITGMGLGIPSLLTCISGLNNGLTALSTPCTFGHLVPSSLVLDVVTT